MNSPKNKQILNDVLGEDRPRLSTLHIITLMATPGIGRKTVHNILNTARSAPTNISDLLDVITETKKIYPRVKIPSVNDLVIASEQVRITLDEVEKLGIKMLRFDDSSYPKRLGLISDPPLILYTLGNVDCLQKDAVAIIGTRKPTRFAEDSARRIASVFSRNNFTIVSGLALGCDTAAHRGCIDAGGQTVAVLAHGLDSVYPLKNTSLKNEILDHSGCLVSEYPPGVSIRNNQLVARDRIQSGLSEAVVVAETSIDGGTMHTAGFCQKQNRILACLLHPKERRDQLGIAGNNKLLSDMNTVQLGSKEDLENLIATLNKPRTSELITESCNKLTQERPNSQMGFGW